MGLTGPNARASGVDWDLRAHEPYGAYREIKVQPIVLGNGDTYDRYMIRLYEMRQSLDIIEQLLDGLPAGPWISDDRKVVLPPRHELHTSMESLIHHFKLVTEGYRVPAGEAYACVEGPRGEMGCNLVSNGSAKPWRVHFRSASLVMLQSVAALCNGRPDRRPDRDPRLARPEHGGLRPVSVTPETLYDAIQEERAKYPTRRGAMLPALHLTQEAYGWLSPEALRACSDAIGFSPAYCQAVASFYDMFFLEPVGAHVIDICTNLACALRGAGRARRGVRAGARRRASAGRPRTATITLRKAECLGGCSWAPVVAVDERYREHVTPGRRRRRSSPTPATRRERGMPEWTPRLEANVLLDFDGDLRDIGAYEAYGGYAQLRRALDGMDRRGAGRRARRLRPARPRRRGLPDRAQGELPGARRRALPRRQRRRVGAGQLQGPRAAAAHAARAARGHPDRLDGAAS